MLNVVLVHPEIPPNTGNIGRLCCAVHARLNLVKPLGFKLDDRSLKRAGLDYWNKLDLMVWDHLEGYLESLDTRRIVLTSSKTGQSYDTITYMPDDHLVFGAETTGLPKDLFTRFPGRIARIPIYPDRVRSLNLSTAVGVVVYEALRQSGTLPQDPMHCP